MAVTVLASMLSHAGTEEDLRAGFFSAWTPMEFVHLYVRLQLLLTIFLVVLLWSLYIRLRRQEFFRWWAWTAFAGFLGIASVVLQLPSQWPTLRSGALLLLLICGFLQVPLLIFGAWSLLRSSKPTRKALKMAIGAAFLIAALTFVWSTQLPANSLTGFAIRTVPRTLTLAVALLFCAWVFLRQWWRSRSWGGHYRQLLSALRR